MIKQENGTGPSGRGVRMKNVSWKDIILIVAIIYFLSPIDFVPGVLTDDVAALGAALLPFLKRALWL